VGGALTACSAIGKPDITQYNVFRVAKVAGPFHTSEADGIPFPRTGSRSSNWDQNITAGLRARVYRVSHCKHRG